MRLKDLDLARGLVHVSNSKTTKGYRIISIHPNFKRLLEKYIKRREQIPSNLPWLFLSKRGTQFSERTIIHLIKSLQCDLNTSFTCHDFRRAFITRLYKKTTDLVLCQRLAGHASTQTTRKYIIDDIDEHMTKFNSLNF